jgi:phage tail-like protein
LLSADGAAKSAGDAGGGGADKLVPGPDNRLFVWENEEAVATTLRPVEETAVWEPLGRRMGVWISTSLDSTAIETEWHKIVLDAAGEPDTQIVLRYYAADRPYAIVGGELVHLDRYIADPSIDAAAKLAGLRPLWSKPIVDPQDALLFNAKGQYLWLYMELIGSDAHSPEVYGIQVHFPRMSYVADLPALYQQDRQSKDFLDRFLSLFQTMMEQTDRHIAQLPRSFDPEAASGESLRWILRWLGLEADDLWSEAQLRDLLKQAPTLHRLRGTRYALEALLTVYTGDKPMILEYEQIRSLKENPEFSGVAEKLYDVETFGFNVLVKLEHADSEAKRVMLQHLIDRYKPAFATARLIVLQPWVYTDLHSYLGLNTVLSEPALLKLDGYSSMPHHTITIDVGQENRVDQHTRLELDSQLE